MAPGEELTISYGPTAASMPDTAARKKALQQQYLFSCRCEGCTASVSPPPAGASSGSNSSSWEGNEADKAVAIMEAVLAQRNLKVKHQCHKFPHVRICTEQRLCAAQVVDAMR